MGRFTRNLADMADGYLEAALFTADEDVIEPRSGEFDMGLHRRRVTQAMRATALADVEKFLAMPGVDEALEASEYEPRNAGHDLWFTAGGHGAGFWECDHCDETTGDLLTKAANGIPERHVYRSGTRWLGLE